MYRNFTIIKKNKTIAVISSLTLIVLCCKSPDYLVPGSKDVTNAQKRWGASTTLTQLKDGYDLYMDKCTHCHGLKGPLKKTEEQWTQIMHIMGRKAKLDSNQYNLVLHYIIVKRETMLAAK